MATLSSIFAWETPWTEKPGGLQPMGSPRVRHNQHIDFFFFSRRFIPFLRKCLYWQCPLAADNELLAAAAAKSLQLCPTLCDPTNCICKDPASRRVRVASFMSDTVDTNFGRHYLTQHSYLWSHFPNCSFRSSLSFMSQSSDFGTLSAPLTVNCTQRHSYPTRECFRSPLLHCFTSSLAKQSRSE